MRGRMLEPMGHATTTIAGGLAAALARQQDALARRWSAVRAGHAKGVHRARVASRRLREALAVIDAAEPKSRAARATRAVRRLTRALGPVREIDVALVELDRAARRHGWSPELALTIRRRLERERERRAKRMVAKIARQDRAGVRDDVRAAVEADDRRRRSVVTGRAHGTNRQTCPFGVGRVSRGRDDLCAGASARAPHRDQEAALRHRAAAGGAGVRGGRRAEVVEASAASLRIASRHSGAQRTGAGDRRPRAASSGSRGAVGERPKPWNAIAARSTRRRSRSCRRWRRAPG